MICTFEHTRCTLQETADYYIGLIFIYMYMPVVNSRMSSRRVTSGDEGLDDALGGGFPEGSMVLLVGEAGTGKSILGSQFVCKGLETGEPGLILLTSENRERYISHMSEYLKKDCKSIVEAGKGGVIEISPKDVSIGLAQLVNGAKQMKSRRLLIDSFTPIAQSLGTQTGVRNAMETIRDQLTLALGCTIILVIDAPTGQEQIGTGVEEFMADGILRLGYRELGGHMVKELTILKFRGTTITYQSRAYTLEGGFRTIKPFTLKPLKNGSELGPTHVGRFQPVPDTDDMFSTGVEQLDRLLDGGYPRGGVVLLDRSEHVTLPQYRLMIYPPAWNFFAHDRGRVALVPLGRGFKTFMAQSLSAGFAEDIATRLSRVITYDDFGEPKRPFVIKLGGDYQKDLVAYQTLVEELVRVTGQPILETLDIGTLVAEYKTEDVIKFLASCVRTARRVGNLILLSLRPDGNSVRDMVESLSDVHLKMDEVQGALVMYGVKPSIDLHFVQPDMSRGYPMPEFILH